MAKDRHLQQEIFDSSGLKAALAGLRHQDQQASFCLDVTTDADKFKRILTPLEHRIMVISKQQDQAEAAFEKNKAQLAKVRARGRQVAALKYDMEEGILAVWSG
ncbi:TPA: hypothetical protein ACH3X2_009074 [Trebouxia sp. C0005]